MQTPADLRADLRADPRSDPRSGHGRFDGESFNEQRKLMVASQLRPSGVNDPRVIAAMATLPRERFVPADRVGVAYADRPVPLAAGREMNTPVITGRLLTELRLRPSDRALLIGAAAGYGAALLSMLVGHVVAVEESAVLADFARDALAGYADLVLVAGPMTAGHPAGAPYDVILIDGGVDAIPDAIVAQLADGGRLGAGIVDGGVCRLVIGRKSGGAFGYAAFEDGDAVRLPGFARAPAFTF